LSRLLDNSSFETRRRFLLAGFGWFRRNEVRIGDTRFRIVRGRSSNRHYLHIHGNEATARSVLEVHVRRYGGTAFFIESDQRNIPVSGGVVDPNRLFSRNGAERSLRGLNAGKEAVVAAAGKVLEKQRGGLIKALKPSNGGLLFAVHNNSQGYSVRDETAGSDEISLPKPEEPHEFFLATQPGDFAILRKSPYNVVLQNRPEPDDGSLSRLSARTGFRYVNLECKLGNAVMQEEMLRWAESNLP
jgi:hypothetical protein